MYSFIEVIEDPSEKGAWIVEANLEDGGIRRALFLDADARSRALDYAAKIQPLRRSDQRRFEGVNVDGQCASHQKSLLQK